MSDILDAASTKPRGGGATFSLRHRMFRGLWTLVWCGLGIWTPTPCHAWRRWLACLFGARIDPTARIYPGVRIWHPGNLKLGYYAALGAGTNCYSMALVCLEDHATVSQGAHLCAGSHDVDDPNFQLVVRPIHISRDAWVAADAFVGPGVTLAEGAVLGACGVTFRDLEAWTIYAGNPARAIRKRHKNSTNNLEASQ